MALHLSLNCHIYGCIHNVCSQELYSAALCACMASLRANTLNSQRLSSLWVTPASYSSAEEPDTYKDLTLFT